MVADFPDEEIALAKVEPIKTFLIEMADAEEHWEAANTLQIGTLEERFAALVDKYSRITKVLHIDKPVESSNYLHQLSGILCSPVHNKEVDIEQKDCSVCFHGTVWHLANWDNLALAMKEEFGAVKVGWVSDEFCPNEVYYDSIITE